MDIKVHYYDTIGNVRVKSFKYNPLIHLSQNYYMGIVIPGELFDTWIPAHRILEIEYPK